MTYHDSKLALPQPVRLTAEDYFCLSEAGAFDSYATTELIEGTIVAMNAQHVPHGDAKIILIVRLFAAAEQLGLHLSSEVSVRLAGETVVAPDVFLYGGEKPDKIVPGEALRLAVEVADTTAPFDLGQKSRLYAQAGLSEYWVVHLPKRIIFLFSRPNVDGSWTDRQEVPFGDPVTALTIPGLTVDTAGLG